MKLGKMIFASMFAIGSAGALAVEMTDDERTYLRERAQALQAERERRPDWDGGTRRVNEAPPAQREAAAPRAQKGSAKRKREPVKSKIGRAARKLPGALVRDR